MLPHRKHKVIKITLSLTKEGEVIQDYEYFKVQMLMKGEKLDLEPIKFFNRQGKKI